MTTNNTLEKEILVEADGPLTWVTLNRPAKRNALTHCMFESLREILASEEKSSSRVIIIRGSGNHFSAGHDLTADSPEIAEPGDTLADLDRQNYYLNTYLRIFDHPKPVIAAVDGYCIAGATQMLPFCDMVFTSHSASISASPMLPIGGGFITPLLAHKIGESRAKLMSYIPGKSISGDEAVEWGLAAQSFASENLINEVRKIAMDIARTPTSVLRMKKMSINRTLEMQGFRNYAFAGAETDVVVHGISEVNFYKNKIGELGLKEALRAFKAGEI